MYLLSFRLLDARRKLGRAKIPTLPISVKSKPNTPYHNENKNTPVPEGARNLS